MIFNLFIRLLFLNPRTEGAVWKTEISYVKPVPKMSWGFLLSNCRRGNVK
ncbi:hypothetical protein ABMA09_22730 [Erwinia rhapontici]